MTASVKRLIARATDEELIEAIAEAEKIVNDHYEELRRQRDAIERRTSRLQLELRLVQAVIAVKEISEPKAAEAVES